eukprot:TRINITY_DN32131_c0_g1_i1.p1 TRINITY_DN32131_c0_g1~~TRINITY_DN32131_c0_g1_i1.p1  ORF type:complete len:545 (-),score=73.09 TRINITY_DN32131_c0_g1_i1:101-1735(-)
MTPKEMVTSRVSPLWRSRRRRLHTLSVMDKQRRAAGLSKTREQDDSVANEVRVNEQPAHAVVEDLAELSVQPSARLPASGSKRDGEAREDVEVPTKKRRKAERVESCSETCAVELGKSAKEQAPEPSQTPVPTSEIPKVIEGVNNVDGSSKACREVLDSPMAGAQLKRRSRPPCGKMSWMMQASATPLLALGDSSSSGASPSSSGNNCYKPTPPMAPPTEKRLDAATEIQRIMHEAESPEEVLNIDGPCTEDALMKAWKKLVLLLHPDKLQKLGESQREEGANALHRVHCAKDELKQRAQASSCKVPEQVCPGVDPECLEDEQGHRKYKISWQVPEVSDPERPVEKYEIWGPRYFSEAGEPYDWCMLASVQSLQSSFVIVEEAPTQQDVMWAADRVLRPTLPLTVYAVNGAGPSEALTIELPWSDFFPWLQGTPTALCSSCLSLTPCCREWNSCATCHRQVPADSRIVIRCTECQGEVLWNRHLTELLCTCCFKKFGDAKVPAYAAAPMRPRYAPPQHVTSGKSWQGGPRWARGGQSGRSGRSW